MEKKPRSASAPGEPAARARRARRARKVVVTWSELAMLLLLFGGVLLALFPARSIPELLRNESANEELRIAYLRNIIASRPKDYESYFTLIDIYMNNGRRSEAADLLKRVQNAPDAPVRDRSVALEYRLARDEAFARPADSPERNAALARARVILAGIVSRERDPQRLKELIPEALSLNAPSVALTAAGKLIALDRPNAAAWAEQAYTLALASGRPGDAAGYLQGLITSDKRHAAIWKEKLADISLASGDYRKASRLYIDAMQETASADGKSALLVKSLRSLRAGNLTSEAVRVADQYQAQFAGDKRTAKVLIELYLAGNQPLKAREISLQLIRTMGI